jgi:glycosyltransferase involved in cell wall biosynthesis
MKKRIAIVYDWIDKWGGVERVLLTLKEMFPEAVFFTSVYDRKNASWAKDIDIKTSFMDRLPAFIKRNRILSLPFFPTAFESMDFRDYDLVISVTSSFAKSVITHPNTKHICYLLTPTRYLWSHKKKYLGKNAFAGLFADSLRDWDKVVSHRPDKIIAISETVRERCRKYYKIDPEVLYPPFDFEYWNKIRSQLSVSAKDKGSYFLIVSRLEKYKNIDHAIKTFKSLKEKLVIVGSGSQKANLVKLAGKNVAFMSRVSDEELGKLYTGAKALIMPQEEDFGYVSLESQFFGTPVIALAKGGAK